MRVITKDYIAEFSIAQYSDKFIELGSFGRRIRVIYSDEKECEHAMMKLAATGVLDATKNYVHDVKYDKK